jgi:hypothetical protein
MTTNAQRRKNEEHGLDPNPGLMIRKTVPKTRMDITIPVACHWIFKGAAAVDIEVLPDESGVSIKPVKKLCV